MRSKSNTCQCVSVTCWPPGHSRVDSAKLQIRLRSVPTTMPVPKGLPRRRTPPRARVGCIWLGSIERLARSLRLNPRWMYSLSDTGPKPLTAKAANLWARNSELSARLRMSALSADCPQAVCGQMGCRFESFLWLVTARACSARCWLELRNLCKPWSNSAAPAWQPIVGPTMLLSACPRRIRGYPFKVPPNKRPKRPPHRPPNDIRRRHKDASPCWR